MIFMQVLWVSFQALHVFDDFSWLEWARELCLIQEWLSFKKGLHTIKPITWFYYLKWAKSYMFRVEEKKGILDSPAIFQNASESP